MMMMKSSAWIAVLVATALVCWTAAIVGEEKRDSGSLMGYKEIHFSTNGATDETYHEFLEAIRKHVAAAGDVRHGIRVMRERSSVPNSELFLLVVLTSRGRQSITVALDVRNLYLEAYRVEEEAFFFRTSIFEALSLVFTHVTSRYTLPFGSNYGDLERLAGQGRENIPLGMDALDQAISTLYRTRTTTQQQQGLRARSLLVVIQMVSEAARYRQIETRMNERLQESSPPGADVLSLEENWWRLSDAIQNANEGGTFQQSVLLQSASHRRLEIDNANTMTKFMALLIFVCRGQKRTTTTTTSLNYFVDHQIIRPVVGGVGVGCKSLSTAKSRIVGWYGFCVQVMDGNYNDGQRIQLWTCNTNNDDDASQLWSLEADGTIRSNGKCLTTGTNHVMIHDCRTAVKEATIWQVWDNGTIINPGSRMVLQAGSRDRGAILTVQANQYALSQNWRATNITGPLLVSIVGFRSLCLTRANDIGSPTKVWVERCVSTPEWTVRNQQWALYQDGSIRLQGNPLLCVTGGTLKASDAVILRTCDHNSLAQRWMFQNGGAILNLHSGLVMDVKRSDPSLREIILYPPFGNPNQRWSPIFLEVIPNRS